MHALAPADQDQTNRRKTTRIPVKDRQEILLGRNAGILVDVSQRGARIRHAGAVRRGASIRMTFTRGGERFSAHAEILATRMVGLGSGLIYESRVHFPFLDHASEKVLRHTMEEIVNVDLRNNVANMLASAGDAQPVVPAPAPQTDCYVRCRLQGSWWNRKITNDSTQPSDGFVVRADTAASEIASLCAAYAAGSAADRDRIRLMASAAAA